MVLVNIWIAYIREHQTPAEQTTKDQLCHMCGLLEPQKPTVQAIKHQLYHMMYKILGHQITTE